MTLSWTLRSSSDNELCLLLSSVSVRVAVNEMEREAFLAGRAEPCTTDNALDKSSTMSLHS